MSFLPLREELALFPGPHLADGQPTWTLQDPARNQFFRIDWLTFEILSRWQMGDADRIAAAIGAETTLQADAGDVESVMDFVSDNQLMQRHGADHAHMMAAQQRSAHGSWIRWLLHNYLFFRIPLVRPDRWLDRCANLVAPLYTIAFLRLTLAALALGCVLVYRNWDQFSATLVDTISWNGLMAYGFALMFVKILHELGHAFTAKRFHCRVPAMGLAFLVMWPVAYTDTNEVWKLADRRQRLAVALAGVGTELVVAVWATLAWALLPDGSIKSVAFVLATLTWITTLIVNASPFMRFDGYFVLSDWLDMPNMHSRSFALARWDLRERLFALNEPPPEYFSRRRTLALVLFAYAIWLYRLTVFIGIAVLVYHFFIKAAGIMLFVVEVGWFILLPVWRELKSWHAIRARLFRSRRARRSALIAALLVVMFVIPWPTRLTASGYLKPMESFPIYAPSASQVVAIPWSEGSAVPSGAPMVRLAAPEMALRIQRAKARVESLRWQVSNAALDELQKQKLPLLLQELASAEAEAAAVDAEVEMYTPIAPFAGQLRDINPELKPGVWVGKGERLALLVKPGKWQVETYLDEESVRRVNVGDGARFFADGLEGPFLPLTLIAIDRDATHVLQNGMLSTQQGGTVATREKRGQQIPEQAVYRVTLESDRDPGDLAGNSWRGHVVIRGNWEAPGLSFMRSALTLVWREAGF